MTFKYATKTQRFVTFLIDFVLLSIASGYIGSFVEKLAGYDATATEEYYKLVLIELNSISSGAGNMESLSFYMREYYIHSLIDRCFNLSGMLVLITLLLIVLPIYWNGNTLGRKATHLVLVDNHGNKANIKKGLEATAIKQVLSV